MAKSTTMTRCKYCHRRFFRISSECPNCHRPNPDRRIVFWIGVVIASVATAVATWLVWLAVNKEMKVRATQPAPPPPVERKPFPLLPKR